MCGRHHKIIDTETGKYTSAALLAIKRDHEEQGIAEISREGARVAQQLLANYVQISVVGNRGNVAIQSPGAVQARSITIKTTKTKLAIEAPPGSIGAARAKVAYCQHLIDRYQEYQKSDRTGKSDFKYAALHVALKRNFGAPWKLLDEARFDEVVTYLQGRIDATILGKRTARGVIRTTVPSTFGCVRPEPARMTTLPQFRTIFACGTAGLSALQAAEAMIVTDRSTPAHAPPSRSPDHRRPPGDRARERRPVPARTSSSA